MNLDSLNSEVITAHQNNERALKGELVQAKRHGRREAAKIGFLGVVTGLIVGVFL